jgi:hypothetical protein
MREERLPSSCRRRRVVATVDRWPHPLLLSFLLWNPRLQLMCKRCEVLSPASNVSPSLSFRCPCRWRTKHRRLGSPHLHLGPSGLPSMTRPTGMAACGLDVEVISLKFSRRCNRGRWDEGHRKIAQQLATVLPRFTRSPSTATEHLVGLVGVRTLGGADRAPT